LSPTHDERGRNHAERPPHQHQVGEERQQTHAEREDVERVQRVRQHAKHDNRYGDANKADDIRCQHKFTDPHRRDEIYVGHVDSDQVLRSGADDPHAPDRGGDIRPREHLTAEQYIFSPDVLSQAHLTGYQFHKIAAM